MHARGVYLTQDTSRIETARVTQEAEADTRIIYSKIVRNVEEKNVGTKGRSLKQGLIIAKDNNLHTNNATFSSIYLLSHILI